MLGEEKYKSEKSNRFVSSAIESNIDRCHLQIVEGGNDRRRGGKFNAGHGPRIRVELFVLPAMKTSRPLLEICYSFVTIFAASKTFQSQAKNGKGYRAALRKLTFQDIALAPSCSRSTVLNSEKINRSRLIAFDPRSSSLSLPRLRNDRSPEIEGQYALFLT